MESANRIYFEQQNKLKELQANVTQQKHYFQVGQYIFIGLLLLTGLILFLRISHHIHEMTDDLERQKDKALAATESKSTFLANMSHEIRTPLNAIVGFIQLLRDQESEPSKLKYLNTIENSSQSLLGIINDILDFSKIEHNKLELDLHDFNPHEAFDPVADLFKVKCSEKNIILNVDIDSSMPSSLHSDPLRIKQVLSNLLSNAVKFTNSGQAIYLKIVYLKKEKILYVCVKDEGIGISEDKQKAIFEAFSQAEATTTRQFGGTGLGLTICYNLIQLLNGTIEVKSELGKGSGFSFRIPVRQGKPLTENEYDTNYITNGFGLSTAESKINSKILLVEDNKTNQMLMGAILKNQGILFDLAEDGLKAVEAYQNNHYDLILMDENMPNMSGSEATIKIRQIEKHTDRRIPIIALTANAMKGDRERFIEVGMDDYLTKPLKFSELQRIIQTYYK